MKYIFNRADTLRSFFEVRRVRYVVYFLVVRGAVSKSHLVRRNGAQPLENGSDIVFAWLCHYSTCWWSDKVHGNELRCSATIVGLRHVSCGTSWLVSDWLEMTTVVIVAKNTG